MCTVTIVPRTAGYRLMCNRDERLSRAPAMPPRWTRAGGARIAFPLDPQGGGTWLALSEEGTTVVLLNREHATARAGHAAAATELRSRGSIPLALIGAGGSAGARSRLARLRPGSYLPFLVVVMDRDRLLVGESDGAELRVDERALTAPVLFTSSSLGDAAADRARRPLFDAMVAGSARPLSGQRRFHDHAWPDEPALSVRMQRADARTVSRSRVDVRHGAATLVYEPLGGAC